LIYAAAVNDHDLWTISAGDIDGDGKNDLFIVNSGNSSASFAILRNTSKGSNISFANTDFTTDGFPSFGALGDIDGDGKPDLVTGELYNSLISVYKNTSSAGTLSFAAKQDYKNLTIHNGLSIGDFDGDHKPDIALSTVPTSSYLEILRNQMDELNIRFNRSTRFCQGDQITLRSSLSAGNLWYKDGIVISGATADSVIVNSSGAYTDTVTMQGELIPADTSVVITVIPKPAKPFISMRINNQLISSSSTGNQWFNKTGVINGATDSIYMPISSDGNYQVQVTLNGCISPLSDPYHYTATDSSDLVRIYPNPVTDWLHIVFNFPNINTVTVVLYNLHGEKLSEKKNVYSGSTLSMTAYTPGIYILRLINESSNEVLSSKKIIKL
jgi:hypothetical protein